MPKERASVPGSEVASLFRELNLRRQDIALRMGVDYRTICRWLAGGVTRSRWDQLLVLRKMYRLGQVISIRFEANLSNLTPETMEELGRVEQLLDLVRAEWKRKQSQETTPALAQ